MNMRTPKRLLCATLLVVSFASCSATKREEPPPTKTPSEGALKPGSTEPEIDAGISEEMRAHFQTVETIRNAVIAGNLEEVRGQAGLLREGSWDRSNLPEEQVQAVESLATALQKATDVKEAALKAAQLAATCGGCHVATQAIATFEWTEAPEGGSEVKDIMASHRWAMQRLWEGLVGPSEVSWNAGLRLLKGIQLPVEESASMAAAAKTLHALANEAEGEAELDVRGEVFGNMLATCASCHSGASTPDE